jgi:hypothetical protein
MTPLQRLRAFGQRRLRPTTGLAASLCTAATLTTAAAVSTGLSLTPGGPLAPGQPARAQGTPSVMEFRWDNAKDYRRLYFYVSETARLKRSEYYLLLRPKDRKTAILKLTVEVPKSFDAELEPKRIKLCVMKEGGMLKRTRCEKVIPATIEISADGRTIDVLPETPVSDKRTIGLYMNLFNPSAGWYQFNARAQAPGDVPISGYLGSWLITIDPS